MIELKFGRDVLSLEVPEENLLGVITGNFPETPTEEEEREKLRRALRQPLGTRPLCELVRPGERVVIMASDITRPSPSYKLLPPVLDELSAAGVRDGDVTVLFGMGIHRAHTAAEHEKLVGEAVYRRVRCMDSTEGEYVLVGTSSRGTPYYVNKLLTECDRIICTGNIDYHYFVGYSGGAKAILPGAANYETIRANHSMNLLPGAGTGRLCGNPVREDIDEIGKFLGIDFILNVVLDEKKRILAAFAGDYLAAHRAGCAYLDTVYAHPIHELADVVVVSCGGYPKDINLYQAQKALDNGAYAVKEGGAILWVGACREGYGEATFEKWVRESASPKDLTERIRREFVLGGHKAAAIAKVLQKADVYMITDLEAAAVERLYMKCRPPEKLQETLDAVIAEKGGRRAKVWVIPQAGSLFPRLQS